MPMPHSCCRWGATELAKFDRQPAWPRLDELGRRIADAADASIGALFAGWRAQPQPDDVNARVALTMHVLREMRGGAHIIAVNACGITPLDAVLASPAPPPRSGPVWAEHLGWTGPFADATWPARRGYEAERLTSTIVAPIYGFDRRPSARRVRRAGRDHTQRHRHVTLTSCRSRSC